MKVNTDLSIEKYVRNAQSYPISQNQSPSSVQAAQSKKVEAVSKVSDSTKAEKPDTDTVSLSKDASITKMSDSERAALVENLKADLDNQMTRFTNMMVQMFQKQSITAYSTTEDGFWKFIASGNYEVDEQTRAEAEEAISEDGYWGVKQTSQRIFDFAHAVAGDDVDKMKEMQDAVEKGFKEAGLAWGGDLPEISGQTHAAVTNLFDEFYAAHSA